ncbi:MAG: glycosyltransferase family 39 protein [Acidobacteria bacterium]|nr:glycosyltransferase family 39 protein [Acidobacteriota bacterium]
MSHAPAGYFPDRWLGLLVAALALTVYVGTAGGSLATTDAVAAYDVTRQIVEHGTVALSSDVVGNLAYLGPDGRQYSPFGLLQSIWNVPFYLAGRAAASVLPTRSISIEMLTKASVALGNAWAAALVVWLTWLLAGWLSGSARTATTAAWITAFSSALWPYSKFGFNVPLAAALLLAAVYFSLKAAEAGHPRHGLAAGLMCGLALLTRHELILAAVPSMGVILWARLGDARGPYGSASVPGRRMRRSYGEAIRLASWWLAGLLPAIVVWGWYNNVRFGSPIETGYLRDDTLGMGGSLVEGLWGLLLSPGGSIILYSPCVLAAVPALVASRRLHPRFAWMTTATAVIFTLFYAQLGSWAGGRSYGPRYLVPLLPLLMVAVALWLSQLTGGARRALLALCLTSAAIQVPGVLVDFAKVRVNFARSVGGPSYEARMHEWSNCPLALNAKAAAAAVPTVAKHLFGLEPRPVIEKGEGEAKRDFSQQFAFSLDFWWIYLFYLRVIPAWVAVLLGLCWAGASTALLIAASRCATRFDAACASSPRTRSEEPRHS